MVIWFDLVSTWHVFVYFINCGDKLTGGKKKINEILNLNANRNLKATYNWSNVEIENNIEINSVTSVKKLDNLVKNWVSENSQSTLCL